MRFGAWLSSTRDNHAGLFYRRLRQSAQSCGTMTDFDEVTF